MYRRPALATGTLIIRADALSWTPGSATGSTTSAASISSLKTTSVHDDSTCTSASVRFGAVPAGTICTLPTGSAPTAVNKATRSLFLVADTPQKMLRLGLPGLEQHIRTIGLYRSKARHLLQTCTMLVERHGGQVPRAREQLEALPGVGRKTANVILNSAYGEPTIAVDTHLLRLGNRTGLAPGKTPLEVERALLRRVPAPYLVNAHHWLILHGRYVCTARQPHCDRCAVRPYCDYPAASAEPARPTRRRPHPHV